MVFYIKQNASLCVRWTLFKDFDQSALCLVIIIIRLEYSCLIQMDRELIPCILNLSNYIVYCTTEMFWIGFGWLLFPKEYLKPHVGSVLKSIVWIIGAQIKPQCPEELNVKMWRFKPKVKQMFRSPETKVTSLCHLRVVFMFSWVGLASKTGSEKQKKE